MVRGILLALALAGAGTPLVAAPLSVRVVDSAGHPVRDAVVTLYPSSGARAPRPGGRYAIAQQNLQFHPFLTIVPVRSEEHTSELQSQSNLVCRLLLEKKKK